MSSYVANQFVQGFSHVGICVKNLERSKKFYSDGLGFQEGALVRVEDRYHELLGISGHLLMHCQFMRLGEMVVELIEFSSPELLPSAPLKLFNQLGLTHLSFRVKDIDVVAAGLDALGGHILTSTRTFEDTGQGHIIFCTDPDGTRIELMAYPDSVKFA